MFELGARRLYTIHAGEKGYAACRITIRGRAGHGSVPLHRDSAILGLAHVIAALERYGPEVRRPPPGRLHRSGRRRPASCASASKTPPPPRAALRDLAAVDAGAAAAATIEPLLGLTFSPTIVRAGG